MSTKSFLSTVKFTELINWSIQYLVNNNVNYSEKYTLTKIKSFLTRAKIPIEIEDSKDYKRVTIKTNNGGVFLRDIENGKNIGTKKQFIIKEGQFLLSKIDARNGAFGVANNEVDGAIITGNFWAFDVEESLINPYFLSFITTTPSFIKFSENASNGTTNRHYLQEKSFLDQEVPLPSLEEQNKIVEAYNQKIKQAEHAEKEALKLESEIENYIYTELGIEKQEKQEKKKGLQFVRFSELKNRWDIPILEKNSNSNYPLVELSEAFNFINRSWRKKDTDTFHYVELGNIHPLTGITGYSELKVSKAPSRATQTIKTGDLIIGTTRPYLKRFAIVAKEYNDCVASSGFQTIENNSENNLEFLLQVLNSDFVIRQFESYMTGALYPAITVKNLKKILIPLPPISKQNDIVEHITTLKEQVKVLRSQAEQDRGQAIKDFENTIFS